MLVYMDNKNTISKSLEDRKMAVIGKKISKARQKALKDKKLKEQQKQKRVIENERQLLMDRQYAIASMNNDHKTMKLLLDRGYKPKCGRGGCGGKYRCTNPKPYSGGMFTSK